MVDLIIVWSKLELALRVHTMVPTVDMAEAYTHASAAVQASSAAVPADLLVSIAFLESRFDPAATSRVESGRRKTGHYPSSTPPRGLGGTLYCGPLQTYAASWRECLELRVPVRAYRAGAAEIAKWLRDKRVRGNLDLALAGYGCGNAGVVTGSCHNYPARVHWVRTLLAHAAPKRVSVRACVHKGPCARTGVQRVRTSAQSPPLRPRGKPLVHSGANRCLDERRALNAVISSAVNAPALPAGRCDAIQPMT